MGAVVKTNYIALPPHVDLATCAAAVLQFVFNGI